MAATVGVRRQRDGRPFLYSQQRSQFSVLLFVSLCTAYPGVRSPRSMGLKTVGNGLRQTGDGGGRPLLHSPLMPSGMAPSPSCSTGSPPFSPGWSARRHPPFSAAGSARGRMQRTHLRGGVPEEDQAVVQTMLVDVELLAAAGRQPQLGGAAGVVLEVDGRAHGRAEVRPAKHSIVSSPAISSAAA